MTKQELLNKVTTKQGFQSIIMDTLAPDHVNGDTIEKRFFYINHVNADGTAGKTYLYYLHDTINDVAWFYNVEAETVDAREPSADQKKINALQAYLKANFAAYFLLVGRIDTVNNWAEAEVFTLAGGVLTRSKVLVFKKGTQQITHLTITE